MGCASDLIFALQFVRNSQGKSVSRLRTLSLSSTQPVKCTACQVYSLSSTQPVKYTICCQVESDVGEDSCARACLDQTRQNHTVLVATAEVA